MRSFNDWYFDLFESGNGACLNQQEIAEEAWDYRQNEVDELQKQRDSFIKAYEIEMDKSIELQKRVDAVKQLIEEYRDPPTEDKTFQHALSIVADELEQALKGDQ